MDALNISPENVASHEETDRDEITRIIGVKPIEDKLRALYLLRTESDSTGPDIPGVKLPEDRGILLKDILGYPNR